MTNFIRAFISVVRAFIKDERGQDIVEYSLLVGFVAVVGIAVFSGSGSNLKGIWAEGNTRLAAANTAVH
jgi:Flp pilus assembly pilin Flp